MQAFRYVYEHYKDDADWFMKADDDTYVILENLRYFLRDYKSSDPVYFRFWGPVIIQHKILILFSRSFATKSLSTREKKCKMKIIPNTYMSIKFDIE
jgi:hypothetical protein